MNPRPEPAAVVDMANRQVCKKSYPDFEWCIPDATSVFSPNCYSPIKGPTHKFCHGNWVLEIHQNKMIDTLNIHLSEEVERQHVKDRNSHEIFISLKVLKVKQNGEESPLHDCLLKSKDMKMLENYLSDKTRYEAIAYHAVILRHLKQTDTLKIICKFRCMDCPVTLAYIPIPSNNGFLSLKRKHPDDELVEFDGSKEKLCPSGDVFLRYAQTLLSSHQDSDVTIKIEDYEFSAHKFVLRARSAVFDKMFSHGMRENENGVVDIQDCEPHAFREFLRFLYTGRLELDNASKDIVRNLYHIGHKYEVEEVTEICAKSISEDVTVETFCEIVTFGLLYEESIILDVASKFFIKNVTAIVATDEWLTFDKEHQVTARDLLIKALFFYTTKK